MTSNLTPKKTPSNLRLRVIYGVLGAALLLGCVWYGPLSFGLFFGLVQAIMLWEFYRMMRAGGYAPATWIGVAVSLMVFFIIHITSSSQVYQNYFGLLENGTTELPPLSAVGGSISQGHWVLLTGSELHIWAVAGSVLVVVLLLKEIKSWHGTGQPFLNVATVLTGLIYVSFPMSLLSSISINYYDKFGAGYYDYRRIFALLFLIWASDIGAYAAGKTFGKHKMAPSISPGKTWEGWAGGFLLTLAVGWAVGFMLPELPLAHRLVAAAVVAVFAPLGDLAESMLKRSVGVKDSGSILPGHGGLLDRFDAFLLVLPVLALLQLLAG